MFRRYFELPAYVIFAKLPHKGIIRICHDIIKPDTGTDKDLLDLRYFPEASQELQVVFMIHIQIFAWFREQALSVLTCSVSQLLVTGRMPEVGSRSAYIVNISFEIRLLRQKFRLLNKGLMT